MSTKSKFSGLGVAMVTPFCQDKSVDYAGLENLTRHLIDSQKVDYLVVQGTTGESAVMTKEEKRKVLDTVLRVNNGKLPVVLGMGSNNTLELVNSIKNFDLTGVDAILSASPYYNKPTQEGIYQHYKMVAEASPLHVILYNVPGRTSSNVSPQTTLRLAKDFKNIIAIKEASGSVEQVMEIIQAKPDDFLVISGDDALTLPIIASGGHGVISVIGNAFPFEFGSMVHLCLEGKFAEAQAFHYQLFDMINSIFKEGNPGGIKEVLSILEVCDNHLRLPLWNVSNELHQALKNKMQEKGLMMSKVAK
jgi:4-hydroxy-tetrahydrodipicolinate synthase